MYTQAVLNSFNFGYKVKAPDIKLKEDNILEGKTICFYFKNKIKLVL